MAASGRLRIGIDLGGTKIEGVSFATGMTELVRRRIASPQGDYDATIRAIAELVRHLEYATGKQGTVGIGMPGSISPSSGTVQNANSTWLNGRALKSDLETALGRAVRLANDANCFALSEATDGAGVGSATVFGVIVGTGCGGGVVRSGQLIDGPRGIGGEWGHNPLPWAAAHEYPGPLCWCGRYGCMETWVSGPGLASDHLKATGQQQTPEEIVVAAFSGDEAAQETVSFHASRLARGLAHVVNILDPDCIVLGGGLSKLEHLYGALPVLIAPHIFSTDRDVKVLRPVWGDASGVRGAARLWPEET